MSKVIHAIDIKRVSMVSLIGVIMGVLLLLIPMSTMISILIIFLGMAMIIIDGINVYKGMNENETSNQLLLDVLGVLGGFLLLVSSSVVVTMVVAAYLLVEAIFKLWKNKFNMASITDEAPKVIGAILLVIASFGKFDIIFHLVGMVLIGVCLLYLGYNYYLYKKSGIRVVK